jgi:hypothetical protein
MIWSFHGDCVQWRFSNISETISVPTSMVQCDEFCLHILCFCHRICLHLNHCILLEEQWVKSGSESSWSTLLSVFPLLSCILMGRKQVLKTSNVRCDGWLLDFVCCSPGSVHWFWEYDLCRPIASPSSSPNKSYQGTFPWKQCGGCVKLVVNIH